MIMQIHELHIMRSGTVTQEMAQYIDAMVKDNRNKSMRIESLVQEYQAQTDVLRQYHMGQQVVAEVIKMMMSAQHQGQQQPQHQGVAGACPTVTEVDQYNGTEPNFPSGQNPSSGPPNTGAFGAVNQVPQLPTSMEIVQRL